MLFAQHRLTLPKLLGSDYRIRFVSGPLIRTPGHLPGIFWLATYPTTFPRGHPAAWGLGLSKAPTRGWGLVGLETLATAEKELFCQRFGLSP
jgi:hypothetical protein